MIVISKDINRIFDSVQEDYFKLLSLYDNYKIRIIISQRKTKHRLGTCWGIDENGWNRIVLYEPKLRKETETKEEFSNALITIIAHELAHVQEIGHGLSWQSQLSENLKSINRVIIGSITSGYTSKKIEKTPHNHV